MSRLGRELGRSWERIGKMFFLKNRHKKRPPTLWQEAVR